MEDGRLNRRLKKTKEIMHLKNSYEFNMNDEKNSRSFCIIFCIFAQFFTLIHLIDKKHAKHCLDPIPVLGATRPSLLADTGGAPSTKKTRNL